MIHPVVQLGDIVSEAITGFASGGRDSDGVAQVRMNNVTVDGALDLNTVIRVPTSQKQLDRHALQRGDILFNNTNSEELVGKTTLFEEFSEPITFSNHFTRIRIKPDIAEPRFVAKWIHAQFKSGALLLLANRWVNQSAIRTDKLLALHLTLPPLPEQRRIADILDRTDALKRKRQEAIKLTDDFLRATFLDMFGNLHRLPNIQLEQVCVQDGIKCGPFGTQLQKNEFQDSGVPLWGIKHVNAEFKVDTAEFLTLDKAKQLEQYDLRPGDIVMTRKGTVGNCSVYPSSMPNGVMHSDLLRLRLDCQSALGWFMVYQFKHSYAFKRQLDTVSSGAIMAGINVSRLKGLMVALPPLSEQQAFQSVVEDALRLQRVGLEASQLGITELASALRGTLSI